MNPDVESSVDSGRPADSLDPANLWREIFGGRKRPSVVPAKNTGGKKNAFSSFPPKLSAGKLLPENKSLNVGRR